MSAQPPFSLKQADREAELLPALVERIGHHRARSAGYASILDAIGHTAERRYTSLEELPWLPVRIFKETKLSSISEHDVFRTLTSSGTTGDPSRIYLDRAAAETQTRVLARTMQSVLGPKRLPMLIVDSVAAFHGKTSYSARGAGVLGMMSFGRDHTWVLDEEEQSDPGVVRSFLSRYGEEPFLIFGFTFLVWQYLYRVARDEGLDLRNGVLIHSGGWKRMADLAVDNRTFREAFARDTGLTRIHDFYGMVEQIGVVHMEGPDGGSLYSPDFAEVIIRDPLTWEPVPIGKPGLIQVISTVPESYPGNVLMTEDLGVVDGIDDGPWPGKRFRVLGRLPRAEARGCSDTAVPPRQVA